MVVLVSTRREKNTWSWGSVSSDQPLFSSSWYILAISWRFFFHGRQQRWRLHLPGKSPLSPHGPGESLALMHPMPRTISLDMHSIREGGKSPQQQFWVPYFRVERSAATEYWPTWTITSIGDTKHHAARILGSFKMLFSVIRIGLFVFFYQQIKIN